MKRTKVATLANVPISDGRLKGTDVELKAFVEKKNQKFSTKENLKKTKNSFLEKKLESWIS